MKILFLLLLLQGSTGLFAQNINEEQQLALTDSFSRFIPHGNTVLDTAMADFNNDALQDVVIVSTNKNDPDQNRSLVVLAATKNGYIVSAKSSAAVLCAGCGGVFGDPYAGVDFRKNILVIHHYGGSAWRWTSDFTFRFQNNQWELIGISQDSYINTEDCDGKGVGYAGRNMKEVNFSTKKLHVIKTKDVNCKPIKDQWVKLTSVPKILLADFNVDKDYIKEMGY